MSTKKLETVDLSFFYKENKQESEPVEYIASVNFVDQNGQPIPWIIKPVSADDEAVVRKNCVERKTDRRTGVINETFDDVKYTQALTVKGVAFPDLFNRDLQKSYGVNAAVDLLTAMLTAGELQSLALKVIEVSGLDDIEDGAKENEFKAVLAKNN